MTEEHPAEPLSEASARITQLLAMTASLVDALLRLKAQKLHEQTTRDAAIHQRGRHAFNPLAGTDSSLPEGNRMSSAGWPMSPRAIAAQAFPTPIHVALVQVRPTERRPLALPPAPNRLQLTAGPTRSR